MAAINLFPVGAYPSVVVSDVVDPNELVPSVYPIAINGRPYLLDMRSGNFARQYDGRIRDSVNQAGDSGSEAAINQQGLWRRSQTSWHLGAGQKYPDAFDSEPFRLNTSKGVNVWTRGELSMLKGVTQVSADTTSNLRSLVVGTRLYVGTAGNVKYTTDLSAFTDCTGEPVADVNSMTTDGYNVFVSFAAEGIWKSDRSISSFDQYITGTDTFTTIKWAKGRLMAAKGSSIYNFLATGAPGTALFTHANTDFVWVGFAGGQNAIYAAGYSGTASLIYRMTIKADATALDAPIVAAELPNGEIVTSLDSYLGFVLIGTTTGFRFASADVNGNLDVGPLIEVGQVDAFASQGRFVWFSYKNFDGTSTGLGRMDISNQVAVNQPAYASDLMVTAQGAVPSIGMFGARPVFTVTGVGVYVEHATNKVASATLDSGIYTWGVPDSKFVPLWDLYTKPLNGNVKIYVSADEGAFNLIGTQDEAESLGKVFTGAEDRVFAAQVRVMLTSDGTTAGPVLTRWTGKAYAAPVRSQIFSVPVLLHRHINLHGREYYVNVKEELRLLRDLVDNPRVVPYQEDADTFSVVVEDVRWEPTSAVQPTSEWAWEGTATILMRSVR